MNLIKLKDQLNTINNSNFGDLVNAAYYFLTAGKVSDEIEEIAKSICDLPEIPNHVIYRLIVDEICLSALIRLGSFLE